MSVPKFADIGKKANDTLSRGFDTKTQVKVSGKNGDVSFEGVVNKDSAASGSVTVTIDDKKCGKTEGVFKTDGSRTLTYNVTKTGVAGLAASFKLAVSDAAKRVLTTTVSYVNGSTARVDAEVVVDVAQPSKLPGKLSVVAAQRGVTAGVQVGVTAKPDEGEKAVGSVDAAVSYKQGDFEATVTASVFAKKYTASFVQQANANVDVVANLVYAADKSPVATVGGVWRRDASTLKAKVDSDANAAFSFSAPLNSNANLTLVQAFNLSGSVPASFGVQVALN